MSPTPSPSLAHAHDCLAELPDRIPSQEIRDLHQVNGKRALLAVATEWSGIGLAIALCQWYWHPLLYLLAVGFIGARQHALLIIMHDASHFIFLKNRKWNDRLSNLLLGWPTFVNVQGFRHFHSDHHRHLNTEKDGNRELWNTHDEHGHPEEDWVFPRTAPALLALLCRKILGCTGPTWMLRGLMAAVLPAVRRRIGYSAGQAAAQLLFYAAIAAALTYCSAWKEFLLYWAVPYCTWHVAIQYIRIICEHSAIKTTVEPYHMTRTTIPTALEKVFILPRNIGYHHEHHWHPGVPFYHLPELHERLTSKTNLGKYGTVTRSVVESLKQCLQGPIPS